MWSYRLVAPYTFEQTPDLLGREQARRPAAKKDGCERPPLHCLQIALQILQQRVGVLGLRNQLRRGVRIEIAVRALPHAPGHVDIECERRQQKRHGNSAYEPAGNISRSCATNPRKALPRWLS